MKKARHKLVSRQLTLVDSCHRAGTLGSPLPSSKSFSSKDSRSEWISAQARSGHSSSRHITSIGSRRPLR